MNCFRLSEDLFDTLVGVYIDYYDADVITELLWDYLKDKKPIDSLDDFLNNVDYYFLGTDGSYYSFYEDYGIDEDLPLWELEENFIEAPPGRLFLRKNATLLVVDELEESGMNIEDDVYTNCAWCHWYEGGKCLHEETLTSANKTIDLDSLAENGIIDEIVGEGFTEVLFEKLKTNLENSNLSKKKAREFMTSFYEELDEAKREWIYEISSSIIRGLKRYMAETEVEIVKPKEFYCCHFL